MKCEGTITIVVYWILLTLSASLNSQNSSELLFSQSGLLSYSMRSKSAYSPASSPGTDGVPSNSLSPRVDSPSLYSGDTEEDGVDGDPIEQALLAEQEENRKLREENQQTKEQNRILINRLQNLGQSVSPTAGEKELLIPEISRELLDNLVRENLRLKREMQTRSAPVHSNQDELLSLRREKEMLVDRVRQLQSLQSASTDEKESLIGRLTTELNESRAEVQELAAQCRQLVCQQQEQKTNNVIADNMKKLTLENGNEVAQLKRQNNELQAELNQLRGQFQEVVQSNTQWQNYDQQREEHIKRLATERHELELKLARSGRVGLSNHDKEVEDERQHLLDCNRAMEHRIQHLERAIGSSQEERERIHALESQLQVFTEDFHQERQDREKAQARVACLEEENNLLKAQLEQFQGSHMAFLANRRSETMQRYRDEYQRQRGMQSPSYGRNSLVSHGIGRPQIVADGSEDEDDDIIDVPMAQTLRGHGDSAPPPAPLPAQQNTLECPKCHQQFPVDDPMLFLEHNDQCSS